MMRKVSFHINDVEYIKNFMRTTAEESKRYFDDLEPFSAVYTLYGVGRNADSYTLTNTNGEKIDISKISGYAMMILNECFDYFISPKIIKEKPYGVVKIEEEE